MPLLREEAIQRGYTRQDHNYDPTVPENITVLKKDDILAHSHQIISATNDEEVQKVHTNIIKSICTCERSARPFRILQQELNFYHKHGLLLPTKHPDVRFGERMEQRPPRELHTRSCDKCGKEIVSVYGLERPEMVYCEACYNKEVYG